MYGDWMTVAASYNAGQNGISRRLEQQGVTRAMDLWLVEETSRYMFRILTAKTVLENPKAYGFMLKRSQLYPYIAPKTVITTTRQIDDLTAFAKEHGVKIATENMWNWDAKRGCALPCACSTPESFVAHLDAVNDPDFIACLDIGHAEMKGLDTSSVEMIHALGHRLQALHIHDNDLVNDSHMIPFAGKVDFASIVAALKAINYQGYLTLEADTYLKKFTPDTAFAGIQNLADAANLLRDMLA